MRGRFAAIPYAIPFRRPLVAARETFRERRGWWIAARDEEGRIGIGEIAPLPGFTTETWEEASRGIERLPQGIEDCAASRAGVDLALLDLEAQAKGRRIADLLADSPRRRVRCHYLLRRTAPEDLAAEAAEAVGQGYGTLKVKIGRFPIEEEERRIAAIRERVGAGVVLRGDANGAWDHPTALAALRRLERYNLDFVEQPVADRLAEIRGRTGVRIAADESAATVAGARSVIAGRSADVLVVKPMAIGGPRIALQIATEAIEQGLEVVVTSILDTPVGVAGSLHVAAALARDVVCGLATVDLLAPTPTRGLAMPARGDLDLPEGPGLGVRLDRSLLEGVWE